MVTARFRIMNIASRLYQLNPQAAVFCLCFFVYLAPSVSQSSEACTQLLLSKPVFITSDKSKIAYRYSGNSDADTVVIFLNGINKNYDQWDGVIAKASQARSDLQFIQVDLFGQGRTSELNPLKEIPFQKQTKMLRELIHNLIPRDKKIFLVGHSYGGGIAARFTKENSAKVAGLLLIAPFVDYLEAHQPIYGNILAVNKSILDFWGMGLMYESYMNWASELGIRQTWTKYAAYTQTAANMADVIALTHGVRYLGMTDAVKNVGTTKINLLVSERDKLIPNSAHQLLWNNVPALNRGFIDVINSSHDSVTESPELVVNALLLALK